MADFLHQRADFADLINLVGDENKITPTLVEKDYWIMHCIWGLKDQGFQFELKGGTSLSKGFGIIQRFSEDIDIRVEPPQAMEVKTGKNHDKQIHSDTRKKFFDWLAEEIRIPDITVRRATEYDDDLFRNGGIRLSYETRTDELQGVKPGVLLEIGFDDTTPNTAVDISSWAFDKALASGVTVIDNRAKTVLCYNPEYTFVEKLQTISTKFRQFRETGKMPANFLRHYYDVYSLLENAQVLEFIGQERYEKRKKERFRKADQLLISENPAFLFDEMAEISQLENAYQSTSALYYAGQPTFAELTSRIKSFVDRL